MRLATRINRLARGTGCPVCSTYGARFVIRTDGVKLRPGAPTVEYGRCPACGQRVLVWFTIAIDRVAEKSAEE